MAELTVKQLAVLKDRVVTLFLSERLPLENQETKKDWLTVIRHTEFKSIEVYEELCKEFKEKFDIDLNKFINITNLPDDDSFVGEHEKMMAKAERERQREEEKKEERKAEKKEKKPNPFEIFSDKVQADSFQDEQPLFYDRNQMWWLWNKQVKFWQMTDDIDILNMMEDAFGLDTTTPHLKAKIINRLKQSGRKHIPLKSDINFIQFRNGLINLKSPEVLIKPSSKYFITNPIPHFLSESDETPTFDKLFSEWVEEKYVPTLYEILAYCLYPAYPIERIFCLVGSGANGKSCFLGILRNLVGEQNVASTDLNMLIKSRFETARLHKKLVCLMGETDFNVMEHTEKIKRLVSGKDVVGFEVKNKNPFEDINYAKLIIATNNLPTTTDKTVGFYRRWTIIDFPNQFTEEKDILATIPPQEYENLCRKCVKILVELLKKRCFTNDGDFDERMKRFEERSNPLEKFWREEILEDFNSYIFKFDFRKRLDEWCDDNRFRKLTDRNIVAFMKEKSVETGQFQAEWYSKDGEKPRWRAWSGIKWKKPLESNKPEDSDKFAPQETKVDDF